VFKDKKTKYPIFDSLHYKKMSKKYLCYNLVLSTSCEPSSYVEAENSSQWLEAMENEIEALKCSTA